MPFFDTFFEIQPTRLGNWLQMKKAEQVFKRLQSHHPRIERILEIGPGFGELANLSVAAGVHYFAIEVNSMRASLWSFRHCHQLAGEVFPQ